MHPGPKLSLYAADTASQVKSQLVTIGSGCLVRLVVDGFQFVPVCFLFCCRFCLLSAELPVAPQEAVIADYELAFLRRLESALSADHHLLNDRGLLRGKENLSRRLSERQEVLAVRKSNGEPWGSQLL